MLGLIQRVFGEGDLIKTLADYSILGIIAFLFLKSYIKREDMFKTLIEDSLKFYKDNTKELKVAIDNLSESLIKNNDVTKQVLSDIVVEVDDLKNKYNSVTNQLIETVLDERRLSKRVFFDIMKLIISRMNYKIIISFNSMMDANGLSNEEKIEILKLNVWNDIKRYKDEACQSVNALDFDTALIETFVLENDSVFDYMLERIADEVFSEMITVDKLPKDHNYFNIKQKFKNIIYDTQSESLTILKEILR